MKKFEIEKLPPLPEEGLINYSNTIHKHSHVRLCLDVSEEIAEEVRKHAYQERVTQNKMLSMIVKRFVSENPAPPRPEDEKAKGKPGPKRKN